MSNKSREQSLAFHKVATAVSPILHGLDISLEAPQMEGDTLNRKENGENAEINFFNEPSKDLASPRKQRVGVSVVLPHTLAEPLSPCSSSTSVDATFEPTIEMMVNDFDDEQTLNEEENLAALEEEPGDEIATLKEESEMPLEELLAKYGATTKVSSPRKKMKKSKTKRIKHQRPENEEEPEAESDNKPETEAAGNADVIVIESGDEELGSAFQKVNEGDGSETDVGTEVSTTTVTTEDNNGGTFMRPTNKRKRRSHLCDLYPEDTFKATVAEVSKGPLADGHYCEEDEEEDDEEADAEGDELDSEYVKKTIMVGSAYQAVIPDGLSQYGDVLPYENEDQLIWEPSQVSEREVESYLECYLKARDTKASSDDDEQMSAKTADAAAPCPPEEAAKSTLPPPLNNKNVDTLSGSEPETSGVIKDNEQALHLLVQCGYDFKEALRRKQLNAVPPTGAMSLWSEEECQKFEEGIQKFGKDFVMIRQHQVRTRTMRELVQFYYLWKKSQRRDIDFANSDTVDHMDIYLNEGKDYGPNPAATGVLGLPTCTTPTFAARKSSGGIQKNFSIMSSAASTVANPPLNAANAKANSNKKRAVANASSSLLTATLPFSK